MKRGSVNEVSLSLEDRLPQRAFFQVDMEEDDKFRILFLTVYLDPLTKVFIGEILMEAEVDKELVTDGFYSS